MRPRAAALILDERKIVLIQRVKESENYWVLPGGSIEENESPEEACKREIKEEVGLDIELQKLVAKKQNQGREEFYFLAKRKWGKLKLGDPEFSRSSDSNRYIPTWVEIDRLEEMNIQPEFIKSILAEPVAGGDATR